MAGPAPSLRGRLLALLLPATLFALASSAVAVYMIVLNASADLLDQGLADAAEICIEELRAHPEHDFQDIPARAQRVLLATPDDRVFFSLRDGDGAVLAGAGIFDASDLPQGSRGAPAYFDRKAGGYWLRAITIQFEVGGVPRRLTLSTTAHKREELMRNVLVGMVVPQVGLVLLTVLLVWGGVRRALEPLARLRDDIGRRSERDLTPLDSQRTPDEVRPLVVEINQLFQRLERAIQGQRNFVADAAHQLRTPIAGLLAQLETADPDDRNPALLQVARRLARLVAQLLSLSRAEPDVGPKGETFDLADLIRDAAAEWLPMALRQGMEIRFELSSAQVFGVPGAWREMLANLVDNAVRYGRTGGEIAVSCGVEGDAAWVRVEDDGPGIPSAEREKVFERFYRVPGTMSEGVGLGLPIVRALAEQQKAKVSLGDTPAGTGLRVEIRIASHA